MACTLPLGPDGGHYSPQGGRAQGTGACHSHKFNGLVSGIASENISATSGFDIRPAKRMKLVAIKKTEEGKHWTALLQRLSNRLVK